MSELHFALGSAVTVVNVGAGTGSYEPGNRQVTAIEPSAVMIEQRPPGAAPVIQGCAENLPFAAREFDAGMAILTVHHWTDPRAGLAELRRVSARQVVLTWDPDVTSGFWLLEEYLPELKGSESGLPTLGFIAAELERLGARVTVNPVPVPADCVDGFLAAYWRRPGSYLDPEIRRAISGLARLDQGVVERAMERLESDLATGRWRASHDHLFSIDSLDAGYRLVCAD